MIPLEGTKRLSRPGSRRSSTNSRTEKSRIGSSAVQGATEDSNESFGHLMRDLHRCFSRKLQHLIEKHDVTSAQWFFLRILWDEDGLTQATLSTRVGLTTATTVVALNTLQSKGLILRRPHPTDGRKLTIWLTTKGRQLEKTLRPCGKLVNETASAGLPENALQQTRRVLQQMRANLLADLHDYGADD